MQPITMSSNEASDSPEADTTSEALDLSLLEFDDARVEFDLRVQSPQLILNGSDSSNTNTNIARFEKYIQVSPAYTRYFLIDLEEDTPITGTDPMPKQLQMPPFFVIFFIMAILTDVR